MTVIPFVLPGKRPVRGDPELAAQLRALAHDIEFGNVRQLVVTVIRQDGRVDRLGSSPTTISGL
ncbi:MAG: hypothetical protein ACM31P_00855 [Actinomycetota bacterium]